MKKWEFTEHTADLKLIANGNSLEEAFSNAGIAMFDYLVNLETVETKIEKKIQKNADTLEKLLFDYLDELLFFLDTEGFLTKKIENLEIHGIKTGYKLTATAKGDISDNYDVGGNIKAVTYHEMKIEKTDKGYKIYVVLDV